MAMMVTRVAMLMRTAYTRHRIPPENHTGDDKDDDDAGDDDDGDPDGDSNRRYWR